MWDYGLQCSERVGPGYGPWNAELSQDVDILHGIALELRRKGDDGRIAENVLAMYGSLINHDI